jgi:hypothetical protein
MIYIDKLRNINPRKTPMYLIVIPKVTGSIPVRHPSIYAALSDGGRFLFWPG